MKHLKKIMSVMIAAMMAFQNFPAASVYAYGDEEAENVTEAAEIQEESVAEEVQEVTEEAVPEVTDAAVEETQPEETVTEETEPEKTEEAVLAETAETVDAPAEITESEPEEQPSEEIQEEETVAEAALPAEVPAEPEWQEDGILEDQTVESQTEGQEGTDFNVAVMKDQGDGEEDPLPETVEADQKEVSWED